MQETYTKPSGTEITVSDTAETRALAEELGWKKKAKKAAKKGAK